MERGSSDAPNFRLRLGTNVVPLVPGDYVIGRANECEFSFPEDGAMSRRHARLRVRETGVEIEDLGSTNGTLLAGRRINGPVRLSPGEVVRVGEHELCVLGPRHLGPGTTTSPECPLAREQAKSELSTEKHSVFDAVHGPLASALANGDTALAVRVLQPAFDALLSALKSGQEADREPVTKAADCLLLVLEASRDSKYWRLLHELERTSGHSLRAHIERAEQVLKDRDAFSGRDA